MAVRKLFSSTPIPRVRLPAQDGRLVLAGLAPQLGESDEIDLGLLPLPASAVVLEQGMRLLQALLPGVLLQWWDSVLPADRRPSVRLVRVLPAPRKAASGDGSGTEAWFLSKVVRAAGKRPPCHDRVQSENQGWMDLTDLGWRQRE